MPPLPGLPPELPTRAEVVLAPDEDTFVALAGGRSPTWEAALAMTDRARILLPAYASARSRGGDPAVTLRHEWAHLALAEQLPGLRVPRWIQEGYASWASGSFDAQEAWRLRVLFALRRAPTLDSLALSWPGDPESARVAYLLSGTAIEFLVRGSGQRGLRIFFDRWRESGAFEPALRRTYGLTLSQFEEQWRKYVKRRYGWLLVFSHALIFWAFLAVVVFAAFRIRRKRDRERMARLRAHEPPENPAFWISRPNPGGNVGYQSRNSPTAADDPRETR